MLYRAMKVTEDNAFAGWVAEFVGKQIERFPSQEWFPYYYGKLLIWANKREESREFIFKTVRLKTSEFWAWDVLSDTYQGDHLKALACLCRALLCPVKDEGFLVNVHERVGSLLRRCGKDADARYEYRRVEAIREQKRWRVKHDLELEQWLSEGEASLDNQKLYRHYATAAEELVTNSLPLADAILEKRFVDNESGEKVANLGYVQEGAYRTKTSFRISRFPFLMEIPHGTPLSVQIDLVNGRPRIVNVLPRKTGTPWDICPGKVGVITGVDGERGRTFVLFGQGKVCELDHTRIADSATWAVGTTVDIKLRHDTLRDTYQAVFASPTEAVCSTEFCRTYKGLLRLHDNGRFAFAGDVFVSKKLFSSDGFRDAIDVKGMAVISFDRAKDCWRWQAVTLETD